MKAKKRESRKAESTVSKREQQPGRQIWPYVIGAFVAIAAAFQVYAPALRGPFLFDDSYLPMASPASAAVPLKAWMQGVRPLLMLSYWLNYQISGPDTGSYHEWAVVFHLINAALVYFILRKLLKFAKSPQMSAEILAIFGAGLFLLHPLQTEAVAYIAGRSDSLSAVFFFGAYALFLYRRSLEISWLAAAGVLALFLGAMATKENTVVLPAVLLLTDYFWNPGFSFEGIKRNWRLYAPMAIGGAIGAVQVFRVLGGAESAGFAMKDLTWYQYLFTEFRVFFDYLRLFLLPSGQTIDYDYPISRTIFDHGAIVGLVGILALTGAALYFHKRYPLACFGLLVFAILLAPTSSIIPIRDPIAERRTYLPMIGLVLVAIELIIELIRRLKISQTALGAALAVVLLVSAALTYRRNIVWSDTIPLWQDAVAKSPTKGRAHFQLGHAYFIANLCDKASEQYEAASKLDKPDFRLLVDWALADNCLGKSDAAISKLQEAAKLERSAHVYSQLAMMYAKTGRVPEALQTLDAAQSIDPNFEVTYVYRGQLMASANNLAGAEQQYRRALELNPHNQQALDLLGQLHSRLPR